MSSNNNNAASALFAHEDTHVWQNRIVGPLYTLTYIAWMILFLIPGLIAGVVTGKGAGAGIQGWSYFSNPWEAMGYAVGESHGAPTRTSFAPLIWPDTAVIVVSIIFFLLALALAVWLVYRVWFRPAGRPVLAVGY